ncbi:MAG: HIT family protein [Clostridia bacterium]|nr:HIT family protein [Clostridia bacterium]
MENCVFCKIIKGEIPCYKIFENDKVLAFLDIANDFLGHTLVIPKKHCQNILDADEKSLQEVMSAVQKISKHYIQNCGFDGVNILNANNKSAEQSVFHLHFHIIPRRTDDKLIIFPVEKEKEFDLKDLQTKLKL